MATDFDGCGFGAITPDLILSSLIGRVTLTGQKRLRVQIFVNTVTLTPVHCGSDEDFNINLRRSMDMGTDGNVILRVNIINYQDGSGIGQYNCGIPKTIPEMLNSLFGEDANGVVYLNVANIT